MASDVDEAGQKQAKSLGRGVQSIEIGNRLLETLASEGSPMMLKDLAQLADFAPAQAHAYLVSYRKIGLIEKDASTGRYRLGKFALDLGITRMRTSDPMSLARDAVIALSKHTALNASLSVWGSFGPTVVHLEERGNQLNMYTQLGTVFSMTGTATGRVFSAFLSERLVKEAMNREKRDPSVSGRVGAARFISKRELEEIREKRFANIEDPPVPGISAYAAPVFDHVGQLLCVVTIMGQSSHVDPRAADVFIPALLDCVSVLSAELGFQR